MLALVDNGNLALLELVLLLCHIIKNAIKDIINLLGRFPFYIHVEGKRHLTVNNRNGTRQILGVLDFLLGLKESLALGGVSYLCFLCWNLPGILCKRQSRA